MIVDCDGGYHVKIRDRSIWFLIWKKLPHVGREVRRESKLREGRRDGEDLSVCEGRSGRVKID